MLSAGRPAGGRLDAAAAAGRRTRARRNARTVAAQVRSICAAHGVLVDFDELLACHSLREFEEKLMLPIYGHASLDDYYRQNNCMEGLQVRGGGRRPLNAPSGAAT